MRQWGHIRLHFLRNSWNAPQSWAHIKYHFKLITPCTRSLASLHDWIKLETYHLRPFCKSHSSRPLSHSNHLLSPPLPPPPPTTSSHLSTDLHFHFIKMEKKKLHVTGFIWTIMQIRKEIKLLLMLEKCCIRYQVHYFTPAEDGCILISLMSPCSVSHHLLQLHQSEAPRGSAVHVKYVKGVVI